MLIGRSGRYVLSDGLLIIHGGILTRESLVGGSGQFHGIVLEAIAPQSSSVRNRGGFKVPVLGRQVLWGLIIRIARVVLVIVGGVVQGRGR